MDRTLVAKRIRAEAYARGFDLVGFASLGPAETVDVFDRWLARGYDGQMAYIARGAAKRHDSRLVMEGARSAVVVGLEYGGREPSGPVARYARGADYHDLMTDRLSDLLEAIRALSDVPVNGRPYVDTGPILERDLARRAGLGWFGKNTNLINPELGSFFFIGALVLDLDLEPDEPFEADRCGTCTRCIDACPTDALVEPRVLDARRCISYLTIELRTAIPVELREPIGELLYGCDICQDVCPWNVRFSRPLAEPAFETREALGGDPRTLAAELLAMSDEAFRSEFQGSPMKRAKLRGLRRNAAVVLGNVGHPEDADLLTRVLDDPEELVREHAAWALGRLAARSAVRT